MNRRLARDLARWEAGEASLDDLMRRHPNADLSSLTALRTRLMDLGAAPTPDAAASWATVAARLGDREVAPQRSRRLRRPVVVAIIAAALAVPTVSYAAPDGVRTTLRKVADLLPGIDSTQPRSDDGDIAPAAVPNPSGERSDTPDQRSPSSITPDDTVGDDTVGDAPDNDPDDGTSAETDVRDDTAPQPEGTDDGADITVVESDDAASTSTTEAGADDGDTTSPSESTATDADADGVELPSIDN